MTNIPEYKPHKPCEDADIETKLRKLQEQLTTAENDVKEKTNTRDTLQTEVTGLTKVHDEADQIYDAYEKAYEQNLAAKDDYDTYIPKKYDEITGKLSPQVMEKIDLIIKGFTKDIREQKHHVAELFNLYNDAHKEYDNDNKAFEKANDEFETFKKEKERIDGMLEKLKTLRETIKNNESEEKEGYLKNNYYWIKQLDHKNTGFKIEAPQEFKNTYNYKWCEMEEAKAKSEKSKKKMTDANNIYLQENENLKQMKNNFDANVIAEISKIEISECLKNQTTNTEQYNIE
jgi:hypothetical protein